MSKLRTAAYVCSLVYRSARSNHRRLRPGADGYPAPKSPHATGTYRCRPYNGNGNGARSQMARRNPIWECFCRKLCLFPKFAKLKDKFIRVLPSSRPMAPA